MNEFTGFEYTKIAVANAYGHDKLLWKERIDWTDAHMEVLPDMADTADSPVQYIKAVNALHNAIDGIPSGYIMGLDACASGYQIMACMTGCIKTALLTNVIDGGAREDLYTYILSALRNETGIADIPREIVKQCIMVVVYGSKAKPKELFGEDTPELHTFYSIMWEELPGSMQLMELIQSFWNPLAIQYNWALPDGHIVVMNVKDKVDKKIEVNELDHATFTHRAKVIMPKSKGLSLTANIVHSIDAYVVREMLRRTHKKGVQIATIHDAFYAHPNDMQLLRETYRNILAELSKSNLMQNILMNISGQYVHYNKFKDISNQIMQNEYALS